MNNAKIGAAVVGGYVLGRTKKAKLAISLGALLAGSRIKPGQVGKVLQDPFVHTLTDQVRSELTGAGRAAATSVLTAKADSLADALHERTVGLREKSHGEQGQADEPDTGRGEEEEQEEEQEEQEERAGEDTGPEDETEAETEAEAEPDADEEPREEAPRGAARGRTKRGKSEQAEEQPRKRKSSPSQSRSKSGGTARSRRQGDG